METKQGTGFKYVIPLISVAILLLALFLVLWLVQRRTNIASKAYTHTKQEEIQTPQIEESSISNSYAFASPLKAKSGGEFIRLTVFVLNEKGLGVVGEEVSIAQNSNLVADELKKRTDSQGKVYFDIYSKSTGLYVIDPMIGNKPMGQTIAITFE